MSHLGIGLRTALPMAAPADDTTTATPAGGTAAPTATEQAVATEFPAGPVRLDQAELRLGLGITGGIAALGGAALLGASLLHRGGGGASRLLAGPLLIGGGALAGGAASIFAATQLGPKTQIAIATNIPTNERALEVAAEFKDRATEVVRDVDGKFAVLDRGPRIKAGGGTYENGYSSGHYYGDGHFHGQHYYGDGHNHSSGYYEPYYPEYGSYYPDPYYPSPNYPSYPSGPSYPSYPDYPSGGTSSGDSGYSYDPPSYDPPDYGGGYDSGGSSGGYDGGYSGGSDSTSNGNPSDSDF